MYYFKKNPFPAIFRGCLILCAGFVIILYFKGFHQYVYKINSYKLFFMDKKILTLNGSMKEKNVSGSELKFLVDTEACKILNVNPFDNSIKRLLNLHPKVSICEGGRIFTYINNHTLYIDKNRKPREVTYCRFKPIFKKGRKSFQFGNESAKFESFIPIEDEFLKAECYNSSDSIIAVNFHMDFVDKFNKQQSVNEVSSNNKTKIQSKHFTRPGLDGSHLNVLLIMLDSTSRINSLRYMPQTRRFLSETLGAVEMLGYNKVADNTMVNMVPFLTGEFVEKQPCFHDRHGVDNCSFIWKKFSKKGYATHFGEDWYWGGTFHFNRPGFKHPPTDYYDHPFHAANEKHERSMYDVCFHGKSTSEVLYDRIYQLTSNLGETPYFSLSIHSRHTHNYLHGLVNIDNMTRNALSKLYDNSLLNNTFLALFGDHGMRFGNVRQTFIGQLEERLPLMFIYVPVWFRRKYNTYFRNLNINSRRLTTHLDMHSTLLHLLDLGSQIPKKKSGKGKSLFNEIPHNRSCQDAGIVPHWCTCNYHLISKDNSTVTKIIAPVLVNHINKLLKKFSKKCEKLQLWKIESSLKLLSRKRHMDEHKIIIKTKPGGAIFESTLMYNVTSKTYVVIGDISRLNMYKGQSDCIHNNRLRKMCFCKKTTV